MTPAELAAKVEALEADNFRLRQLLAGLTASCPYVECEWYDGGKRDPKTNAVICEGCNRRYKAMYEHEVGY